MSFLSETTPNGANKVTRYNWSDPGQPGEFRLIHKQDLHVDHSYQRDSVSEAKISRLTKDFEWRSFNVICVALRDDGTLYVFDGQHRVLSARRRSDIDLVPCIVFPIDAVQEEATAFLSVNTNRKAIGSLAKHRALVTAGDSLALFVDECLRDLGLSPVETAKHKGQIRCLSICHRIALTDRTAFRDALRLAAEISNAAESPVQERILLGLGWIIRQLPNGASTPRFQQRVRQKGLSSLEQGINRAAAFYTKGGDRVYGVGILEELNKGLQRKLELQVDA